MAEKSQKNLALHMYACCTVYSWLFCQSTFGTVTFVRMKATVVKPVITTFEPPPVGSYCNEIWMQQMYRSE